MSQPDAQIRPYRLTDRSAVRRIAWETADKGQPGDRIFPDREFLVDLVTRYYTDFEPGSAWVAESQGQVVGYVTGCLDTRRFLRLVAWRILPAAAWSALRRGTLLAPRMRRLARLNIGAALVRHGLPCRDYPAHLHVNLEAPFRGRRLGRLLAERFLDQARAAGVAGAHASVREDNPVSRRFFEQLGFSALRRRPLIRIEAGTDGMLYSVIYTKRLS